MPTGGYKLGNSVAGGRALSGKLDREVRALNRLLVGHPGSDWRVREAIGNALSALGAARFIQARLDGGDLRLERFPGPHRCD